MKQVQSIQRFGDELKEIFSQEAAGVYLCGPPINNFENPGEKLKQELEDSLKKEGFDIILGEDDGLERIGNRYSSYAHEDELLFVEKHCLATILIASSVSSFCELGLFSYKKLHSMKAEVILIIDEQYKEIDSYLNEGPVGAIEDYGKVYYGDLLNFDYSDIIERLKRRRVVWTTKYHGRRPGEIL